MHNKQVMWIRWEVIQIRSGVARPFHQAYKYFLDVQGTNFGPLMYQLASQVVHLQKGATVLVLTVVARNSDVQLTDLVEAERAFKSTYF